MFYFELLRNKTFNNDNKFKKLVLLGPTEENIPNNVL